MLHRPLIWQSIISFFSNILRETIMELFERISTEFLVEDESYRVLRIELIASKRL